MRRMQEVNWAYTELAGTSGRLVFLDTPGWSNDQRAKLTLALLNADIPHRWDQEELSVNRAYEAQVDRLLEAIDG